MAIPLNAQPNAQADAQVPARMSAKVPAKVIDLGNLDYRSAWHRQLERVEQRKRDACADALLMLEHPHVFTMGRSRKALANILAPGEIEVVRVERGGDVTYHGPGQLVAYPIVKLGEGERDLHRFLRNLEEGMIRTLARHGLTAGREPGKTGVWIHGRKLASIGIACRRWVTFHGLALNVTTDLSYFHRINPCGFQANVMTSMAAELGHPVAMTELKEQLTEDLGAALGRRFEP